MKVLNWWLVALALSGASCLQSTTPRLATVSGVVRYVDGGIVFRAMVSTDAGATTFTDERGRYSITVPVNSGSMTVVARDGFTPGLGYGVISFGSTRVRVGPRGARGDVVLDHAMNI